MQMQMQTLTRRWLILSLAALASLGGSSLLAAPDDPRLASAAAGELWRKGSDQVLAGDFASARLTLEQFQKIEPNHPGVRDALTWMKGAGNLRASRDRYRQRMYDYHVGKALEATAKAKELAAGPPPENTRKPGEGKTADPPKPKPSVDKPDAPQAADVGDGDPSEGDDGLDDEDCDTDARCQWRLALRYAQLAMSNAADEGAFRAEPWLAEIVDHAKLEIESYRTEGAWPDALTLYDILKHIYPDTPEYEDGFDFCRKRAHLDFVYGPKGTWKVDLADVTPNAVREILDRIDNDYVKKPVYRDLCRRGLEHLLLLGHSETLIDTFPTLGEKDLVARFTNRLEALIDKRVEGEKKFGEGSVQSVFRRVLAANEDTLNLPEAVIVDEFMAGLLEPLDEFTSVIWPSDVSEFNKQTRGEFTGVGIQITQEIGKPIRVESPLEDSPAYLAGIKPGDLITHVDGKSTIEMNITSAVREIMGEIGSTVVLTILDPLTNESRDVPLKRAEIKIRTVRGNTRDADRPTGWDYFIDLEHKIGYVRVSGFMDQTVPDLRAALEQLHDEDCRGLILDLRFNPGGLLTSAVNMCELFLEDRAPIVQTKGRNPHQNMTITARSHRPRGDFPLIVLVNEYSASASEIVAGALAGLKEACIIGTRTFGKGSVQNLIPIADNQAYLKLTTAHYFVPDADLPDADPWYLLHREKGAKTWGVEPHISVKVIPQELAKILRLRRERDVLKGKGQEGEIPEEILERRRSTTKPADDFPEDEDKDIDPQIATAVDVMRMKLISKQPWALAPRLDRTMTQADTPKALETANHR